MARLPPLCPVWRNQGGLRTPLSPRQGDSGGPGHASSNFPRFRETERGPSQVHTARNPGQAANSSETVLVYNPSSEAFDPKGTLGQRPLFPYHVKSSVNHTFSSVSLDGATEQNNLLGPQNPPPTMARC